LERILLIGSKDLITGGIASLLQRVADVNLHNKTIKDFPHLINELNELRPAILVLNNNLEFATSSLMLILLGNFPDLRILVIDERKNIIHVYEKQEVQVTQSADLLGFISRTKCLIRDLSIT